MPEASPKLASERAQKTSATPSCIITHLQLLRLMERATPTVMARDDEANSKATSTQRDLLIGLRRVSVVIGLPLNSPGSPGLLLASSTSYSFKLSYCRQLESIPAACPASIDAVRPRWTSSTSFLEVILQPEQPVTNVAVHPA